MGQTELVGTRPEYRGRGLVRAQFEVLHEWSAQRGELMQVIAGIPWFYRQFGYEMALPRGGGPRFARTDLAPPAPGVPSPSACGPCARTISPSSWTWITARVSDCLVSVPATSSSGATSWRAIAPGSSTRLELRMLESAGGEPAGFIGHFPRSGRGRPR